MFAVIKTGGKQYHVKPGDIIKVEKIEGQAGDQIQLETLYTSVEGKVSFEKGSSVSAEIINQDRHDKIIVFKKKRRQNYRRLHGHKQHTTVLRVTSIGGEGTAKKATKKAAPKKEAEAK